MLQIGRISTRGAGAVVVSGPFGTALVGADLAAAAHDVLAGRGDVVAFLAAASQSGATLALLDCGGPRAYLTVLGAARVRGRALGESVDREFSTPLWGWPVDPGQWQVLELVIDEDGAGAWAPVVDDRAEAGALRIGRTLDEAESTTLPAIEEPAVAPPAPAAIPSAANEAASAAEPVALPPTPPIAAAPMTAVPERTAPVPAPPAPAPSTAPAPAPEVDSEFSLVVGASSDLAEDADIARGVRVERSALADSPDWAPETPLAPVAASAAPMTTPTSPAPATVSLEPEDPPFAEPGDSSFARFAHAAPSSGFLWAPEPPPLAPDPTPDPEPAPEPEPVGIDDEPPALGAEPPLLGARFDAPAPTPDPDAPRPPGTAASQSSPPLGGPADPTANPEALEETMTPEMLERLRAAASAEETVMRRVPAGGARQPVGYLVHGGSAPVEASRDVVIGRDPDARALTGRPAATTLRLLSPAHEISRSHCAVIATAPGAWSLMDLGSANGTLLRHADGSVDEAAPMLVLPLADGDLIDVGESTTIEFRIR